MLLSHCLPSLSRFPFFKYGSPVSIPFNMFSSVGSNHPSGNALVQEIYHNQLPLSRIRNIGIIAHVDAGKTTTSERLLYYSGTISKLGDVDKGNTTMDYMKLEKDRGITITSAAITLPWQVESHKWAEGDGKLIRINLIDTPGHIDFGYEVERSTRVLDGAITVLDASLGVQAQTLTADRHRIPRIVFLNKMDKEGADPEKCVKTIKDRLGDSIAPILIQYPIGSGYSFSGIIDLLDMNVLTWEDYEGRFAKIAPLSADSFLFVRASAARERLIEQLIEYDTELLEIYLESPSPSTMITSLQLLQALSRATQALKIAPILIGSSFRNRGVQPLLDSVVTLLPSPLRRPFPKSIELSSVIPASAVTSTPEVSATTTNYGLPPILSSVSSEIPLKPVSFPLGLELSSGPLVALAFKVIYDRQKGLIVYCRVYSGTLRQSDKLFNSTSKTEEKVQGVFRIEAGTIASIGSVSAGDIAALTGLKNTKTGDTLLLHPSIYKSGRPLPTNASDFERAATTGKLGLEGVRPSPPVFTCSLEPESLAVEKDLFNSLELLNFEDPSTNYSVDCESGQLLLSGMGELHIETVVDRLRTHFNVNPRVGPIQISYKSCILEEKKHLLTEEGEKESEITNFNYQFPIQMGKKEVTVSVSLRPGELNSGNTVQIELNQEQTTLYNRDWKKFSRIFKEAVLAACHSGIYYGFGLTDTIVTIHSISFSFTMAEIQFPLLLPALSQAIKKAAESATPWLMEPIMKIEITVPDSILGVVISDLTGFRKGVVDDIFSSAVGHSTVHGHVPLRNSIGYSTGLRSLTQGQAIFSLEFHQYEAVKDSEMSAVMKSIRGF